MKRLVVLTALLLAGCTYVTPLEPEKTCAEYVDEGGDWYRIVDYGEGLQIGKFKSENPLATCPYIWAVYKAKGVAHIVYFCDKCGRYGED